VAISPFIMTRTPTLREQVTKARQRLAEGRARIQELHQSGATGPAVSAALADLIDEIVLDLFQSAVADLRCASAIRGVVTLAPLGGYGRRDLAPYSDVDLMVLVAAESGESRALSKRLMQDLYDVGLEVGFSVRTPKDAWSAALDDATIFTSLVEARYLTGSASLFSRFAADFQHLAQRGWKKLIPMIEKSRSEERGKHGESGYKLNPNVKRSRGGLRGIQLLRWVGFARYGLAEPDELAKIGALAAEDRETIDQAAQFLLRLRNELHFHAGRSQDVLDRAEQVRLAPLYGCQGAAGLLPVEQFMRRYFQITDDIRYVVANFVAAARPHKRMDQVLGPLVSRRVGRDYRVGPIHLSATDSGLAKLRTNMAEVIRLTELAATYDKRISHDAWIAVRGAMRTLEQAVTPQVCQRFMSLLSQPARLGEMLRRLNELGVLERIIPAFGHARCLLQFNQYHHYTVDEHSILAVEAATRLANHPGGVGAVYRQIRRKDLLHLALLVHDLGKGFPEDHSEVGLRIAGETAVRLGLPPHESEILKFLVHKHLLMTHLALWRDIDDDQQVLQFAIQVGSPEALQMLYVHSAADLDAVGPGVLNDWKLDLLNQLYERALLHLGGEEPTGGPSDRARQAKEEVLKRVCSSPQSDWFARQVDALPTSYLHGTPPEQIATELSRLAALPPDRAEAWSRWLPGRQVVEYTVATHEAIVPGVFHRLTGTLTSKGLQILSAQINTLADGLILDRFFVTDPDHSGAPPDDRQATVCQALVAALAQPTDALPTYTRRWPTSSLDTGRAVTVRPTRIEIDNNTSDRFTIIDVFTQDRMGLLYTITRMLFELDLSVGVAKIGTYLDQVIDVFYVTDRSGGKVTDAGRLADITSRMKAAIESPPARPEPA
jgi:[protein-PII] uridylyltransferase